MPRYRHYRLDKSGRIVGAEWIEASDDADAERQIRSRALRIQSEIWQGERFVALLEAQTLCPR